jgi:hypothetical protein
VTILPSPSMRTLPVGAPEPASALPRIFPVTAVLWAVLILPSPGHNRGPRIPSAVPASILLHPGACPQALHRPAPPGLPLRPRTLLPARSLSLPPADPCLLVVQGCAVPVDTATVLPGRCIVQGAARIALVETARRSATVCFLHLNVTM